MTREFQIEQRLVQQAEKHKFICWKWQSTRRGVPDRIIIANGRTVFVELKAPNEKPSKQQQHVHELMRQQGAEVCVIDSFEEIDDLINRLIEFGCASDSFKDLVTKGTCVIRMDTDSLRSKALLDSLAVKS